MICTVQFLSFLEYRYSYISYNAIYIFLKEKLITLLHLHAQCTTFLLHVYTGNEPTFMKAYYTILT